MYLYITGNMSIVWRYCTWAYYMYYIFVPCNQRKDFHFLLVVAVKHVYHQRHLSKKKSSRCHHKPLHARPSRSMSVPIINWITYHSPHTVIIMTCTLHNDLLEDTLGVEHCTRQHKFQSQPCEWLISPPEMQRQWKGRNPLLQGN